MSIKLNAVKQIFLKELREIARDKKIIILTVVLPIIMYPIIFFGIDALFKLQEKKFKEKGMILSITGDKTLVAPYISDLDYKVSIVYANKPEKGLADFNADIAIEVIKQNGNSDSQFWIYYDGAKDKSLMAYKNLVDHLDTKRSDWIFDRLKQMDISTKDYRPVALEISDISSQEARSGHLIGKILPFILILMLVSGCSFTAVDLIAGEKERGCFETILVTSVSRRDLIIGKFLVVLSSGLVAVSLNLLGMLISLNLGILKTNGKIDFEFHLSVITILSIIGCVIPLGILFAAILVAFSAKANSFQEGQLYLMPFSLLAMLPALVASIPGIHSDSFVILVPIANIAVVMREFLEQSVKLPFLLLANLINLFYAAFVLKLAVNFLEGEGTLISGSSASFSIRKQSRFEVNAGIGTFAAVWLLMYFVMAPLQQWDIKWGLLITLYGLCFCAALVHVRVLKLPLRSTLRLNNAPLKAWISVPFFSVGMLLFTLWFSDIQMQYLPFPEKMGQIFQDMFKSKDLSIGLSIFLFCVSPGICEEFLFRGAIMGGFTKKLSPWRSIIITGILFGFLHFSIYRFLPTTFLGIGFGYLVLRSNSLFPAIIAHALNNLIALHLISLIFPDNINNHWLLLGLPIAAIGILLLESVDKSQAPQPT